ncbi:low molecular weight phosphatase family protein [Cryobacterium algoricola]|uniref:Low molecular weight phosphatase family protein n=2 Tax=Cryobacterium algoricola TaxID=1259183 RepID=A0ABY2ID26_9MICO|nr:low molecular weight phosphatase family protein [Cryobacterium algoricola]
MVCTGNICRSPLAEQLLQTRLAAAGVPATVTSAGTRAVVGHPMTPEAAALAILYGAAPLIHAATQLTPELVAAADLVLTATREHRSEAVALHPRAARYAYTLNQFARLVDAIPPTPSADQEAITAYLSEVSATKGLTPPPHDLADDDIEDPYRQSEEIYDRVAHSIDDAVTTITTALAATTVRL